jgi:glycosyltransferase involved in cell wall biosynthesis
VIIHHFQQFFAGPNSPGTLTPRKLVRLLADRGHQVHVVAGDFNAYSEQEEPSEDQPSPGGGRMQVHRLPAARGMRRGLRARLETYLGYAFRARRFARTLPRPDVVVGSIQPLFTGWVARRQALRWGVPFLLEVRDLWPDALVVKGAITAWQAWPLHRLANRLYAGAGRVVSLTPGIKTVLVKKGLPPGKVDVLTNGFDPELYQLAPGSRDRVRAELGWQDRFVALFTGTHVEVTAVETIVRTAAALRERTDIRFDLFGQGQRKPAAMALAQELGLANIHFHDPVPKRRIPELLEAADVALMTLFKSPLIDIYFENKLLDYMGAGKPILAAMDGMQSELIRQFQTGRAVGSFDHEGLAGLVTEAAADYEPLRAMGANGRRLVQERFLMSDILNRYAIVIEAVAERRADKIPAWDPLARSNPRCS